MSQQLLGLNAEYEEQAEAQGLMDDHEPADGERDKLNDGQTDELDNGQTAELDDDQADEPNDGLTDEPNDGQTYETNDNSQLAERSECKQTNKKANTLIRRQVWISSMHAC